MLDYHVKARNSMKPLLWYYHLKLSLYHGTTTVLFYKALTFFFNNFFF